MIAGSAPSRAVVPIEVGGKAFARDWFLRNSTWQDDVWILTPTNVLEHDRPVRISWSFALPSGRRFTNPSFARLLESSRILIALIRTRCLSTGLAQRGTTVFGYFHYLRGLVRWMEPEGFSRFADLNASALRRFQLSIERRTNQQGARLARTTVQKYLDLLVYMYRYRLDIGDGLTVDPCLGQSSGAVAGVTESNRGAWPYTPDVIAVPLIQGSIEFLSRCAVDLLRAREMYANEIETQQHRCCTCEVWRKAAIRLLQRVTLDTPNGQRPTHD